jgi:hypothetical protein
MIFGIEKVKAGSAYSGKITFAGNEYRSHLNRDLVEVSENVEIVGEFNDGHPAVTVNQYGSGYGVYIATQADGAFVEEDENKLLGDVVDQILTGSDSTSNYEIRRGGNRATGIDPHILETDEKSWVLFSNYLEHRSEIDFSIRTNQKKPEAVNEIFPSKTPIGFSVLENLISLSGLGFESKEVKVIEICWS